jgi:hypothetical protein
MDERDFILHGAKVANPNYDKKEANKYKKAMTTGKMSATSPIDFKAVNKYTTSNNPQDAKSTSEKIDEHAVKTSRSLSHLTDWMDAGYKVNFNTTYADLRRQESENQNVFIQFGNAITQVVENELVLGTALGFSNMYDVAANLAKEKGDDDYTNPVSTFIEQLQEANRERLEIHQKNPGEAWDVADTGWWMNGLVDVGSFFSLVVPAMGATKVLSLAAKFSRADRISMKLANAAAKAGKISKPAAYAEAFNFGVGTGTTALFSRTMENMLEAREVYKTIYDSSIASLDVYNKNQEELSKNTKLDKSLSFRENLERQEQERERRASVGSIDMDYLFEQNPDLRGKSNEEIAKYIASVSADKVFRNDYWMLGFDVLQLGAIRGMLGGVGSKASTKFLDMANRRAAGTLLGEAEGEAAALAAKAARNKLTLKNIWNKSKWPLSHLSEGFEEGFQGVQIELGKEHAESMLNPAFSPRSYSSYLSDPFIWEQAFWGTMGSLIMQGGAKGLKGIYRKAKGKYNKAHMSPEDYLRSQITEEKAREMEILSRTASWQMYVGRMNMIDKGINPFKVATDEQGNEVKVNGNPVNEVLTTEEEKEVLRSNATAAFINEMTIGAIKAGNYDLLKDYFSSPEMEKYIDQEGLNKHSGDKIFTAKALEQMERVKELYNQTLYDFVGSLGNKLNGHAVNILTTEVTRKKLLVDELNKQAGAVQNKINWDSTDAPVSSRYEEQQYLERAEIELNKINKAKDEVNASKISKQAKEEYNKILEEQKDRIYKFIGEHTTYGTLRFVPDKFTKIKEIFENKGGASEFKYFSKFVERERATGRLDKDMENTVSDTKIDEFMKDFEEFMATDTYGLKIETPAKDSLIDLINKRINFEYQSADIKYQIPVSQDDFKQQYDDTVSSIEEITLARFNEALKNVEAWLREQDDMKKAFDDLLDNNVAELKDDLDILKLGHDTTQTFTKAFNTMFSKISREKEAEKIVIENGEIVEEGEAEKLNESLENALKDPSEFNVPGGIPGDENPQVPQPGVVEDIANFLPNAFQQASSRAMLLIAADYRIKDGTFRTEVDSLIRDASNNILNNELFTKLVDKITNALLDEGIDKSIARDAAIDGLKIALKRIANSSKMSNIADIAMAIATMQKLIQEQAQSENATDNVRMANFEAVDKADVPNLFKEYIDAYVEDAKLLKVETTENEDIEEGDNFTAIDVNDLFLYLINNNILTANEAKLMFIHVIDLISNETLGNYKFTGRNMIDSFKDNVDGYFQALADYQAKLAEENVFANNMHVPTPTYKSEKMREAIAKLRVNQEITFSYTVNERGEVIKNSISGKDENGVEVTYLAAVKYDKTADTFELKAQGKGFVKRITRDKNGVLHENFDKLFYALIDRAPGSRRLFATLQRVYVHNSDVSFIKYKNSRLPKDQRLPLPKLKFDEKQALAVLNHPIISEMINKGEIKLLTEKDNKTLKGNIEQAIFILNSINNILRFSKSATTTGTMRDSYNQWKIKMWDNYTKTLELQNALDANAKTAKGKSPKYTVRATVAGVSGSKLIISDFNTDITDPRFAFNPTANPIIGVDKLGGIQVEGDKAKQLTNNAGFRPGSMGFLIKDTNGIPMVALFTDENKVSGSPIATMVYNEITDILTAFNNDQSMTLDDLYGRLSDLLGNNLFKGYAVSKLKGGRYIGIRIVNPKGADVTNPVWPVVFTKVDKSDKNTKSAKTVENIINYHPNGNYAEKRTINTSDAKAIHDVAKELTDGLVFNRTFFTIKDNPTKNRYMSKSDTGKFVISMGGNTIEYENFGDFALRNNAFKTNQGVNESTGYFEGDDNTKSVFIDLKINDNTKPAVPAADNTRLPVGNGTTITDVVLSATEDVPVSGKTIIEVHNNSMSNSRAKLSQESIDLLIGNNIAGLSLVPDEVYYMRTPQGVDIYDMPNAMVKNGKMFLTENGLGAMMTNGVKETVRLLMHERLHQLFADATEETVNELLNIHRELFDAVNDDLSRITDRNDPRFIAAKQIADVYLVPGKEFTLETYANNLSEQYRQIWDSRTEEENRKIFAEEFLVECLTQPILTKYLNETESIGEYKTNKAKSLWQKIMQVIIKLANIKRIAKGSLLEREYAALANVELTKIFSSTPMQNIQTVIESEANIDDIETIIESGTDDMTDIDLGIDNSTTYNMDEDNFFNDIKVSAIPSIGILSDPMVDSFINNPTVSPVGISIAPNAVDFANSFPLSERDNILKRIHNNDIVFICGI